MDTVGAAIGPVLALIYLAIYPGAYKNLFMLAFIPGILSVLIIFFLKEKKQPVSTLGKGNFFSFLKYWTIAGKDFRRIVPALLLFALFNSSDIFLLLVTKQAIGSQEIHFNGFSFNADSITIAAYVFYNLVYASVSYPAGMLADKIGFRSVVITGMALFGIVYSGFAFNPSIPVIFFLFALYGFYAAFTEGVIKAWITNLAGKHDTATAIGFYTSGESIAALFASILAGAVWTGLGSEYTFFTSAAVALIVAFYLLITRRQTA
jgi:MFS family permease